MGRTEAYGDRLPVCPPAVRLSAGGEGQALLVARRTEAYEMGIARATLRKAGFEPATTRSPTLSVAAHRTRTTPRLPAGRGARPSKVLYGSPRALLGDLPQQAEAPIRRRSTESADGGPAVDDWEGLLHARSA
jgi:hypothetical protein